MPGHLMYKALICAFLIDQSAFFGNLLLLISCSFLSSCEHWEELMPLPHSDYYCCTIATTPLSSVRSKEAANSTSAERIDP